MAILLQLLPLLAPLLGQILAAIEAYFGLTTIPTTTETVLGDVAAIVNGINKDYPTMGNVAKTPTLFCRRNPASYQQQHNPLRLIGKRLDRNGTPASQGRGKGVMRKLLTLLLLIPTMANAVMTFTVNSTLDAPAAAPACNAPTDCDDGFGNCTLRGAIQCLNFCVAPTIIDFNINAAIDPGCNPGTGVCTLTPATDYPTIVASNTPVQIIDATAQSGSSCGDLWGMTPPVWNIVIDCSATSVCLSFNVRESGVRGIHFLNPANIGVVFVSVLDFIQCSKIDSSHDFSVSASPSDALLIGGVNTGDGNVFVGQVTGDSVLAVGNTSTILGNFIGVKEDGITAQGNGAVGINSSGHMDVRIGVEGVNGTVKGNLISANTGGILITRGDPGITLLGGLTSPLLTRVVGNYIGTDVTGLVAIPNTTFGIGVESSGLSTIGQHSGTLFSTKNIISGNALGGVNITTSAVGTVVQENYIGVDSAGNPTLCNGGSLGNDLIDFGMGTTLINNLVCNTLTPTPTITPTITPTVTPTATPAPPPAPGCCNGDGNVFGLVCIDNTFLAGGASSPAGCATAFAGAHVTPAPPPTPLWVDGFCPGGFSSSTPCIPLPTATPTISIPTPTRTISVGPAVNCSKLVLNQPLTNPPTQSWASELIRRLSLPNFAQCK